MTLYVEENIISYSFAVKWCSRRILSHIICKLLYLVRFVVESKEKGQEPLNLIAGVHKGKSFEVVQIP